MMRKIEGAKLEFSFNLTKFLYERQVIFLFTMKAPQDIAGYTFLFVFVCIAK